MIETWNDGISAVIYTIDDSVSAFGSNYPPEAWIELEVRGGGTIQITSGYPKNIGKITDALSNATGLNVITQHS